MPHAAPARTAGPTGRPGVRSLVTTPTASRPTCDACGSRRLTSLTMTLTDGTPVDFTSCHHCEHQVWKHGQSVLDRADVLARATKPRPAAG